MAVKYLIKSYKLFSYKTMRCKAYIASKSVKYKGKKLRWLLLVKIDRLYT